MNDRLSNIFYYHHTNNMKPQRQCTRVMFWDNLVNYYCRFGLSGLNLAYEGLLLVGEVKASRRLPKTVESAQG
jgi:hypothetical protein